MTGNATTEATKLSQAARVDDLRVEVTTLEDRVKSLEDELRELKGIRRHLVGKVEGLTDAIRYLGFDR